MSKSSRIPGFYKLSADERLDKVKEFADLTSEEIEIIKSMSGIELENATKMIENSIGGISVPIGIATNFIINQNEYLIPLATEEPSVIAACSNAAGLGRKKGGFTAKSMGNVMRTQIQLIKVKDLESAKNNIEKNKSELLELAQEKTPTLSSMGGGAKDLQLKELDTKRGKMLIVEIYIDCKDAMGANACNTVAESLASKIEQMSDAESLLKIVSNLATERIVEAHATFDKESLGGEQVVERILDASEFAHNDSYRAVTSNKGIMNGITSLAIATGQDIRAIESAAHAYASISGRYIPLTTWEKDTAGDLIGKIKIPMPVGIIGGASSVHPTSKICLKILNVNKASQLAEIITSVGLAQNLAAIRALVNEGIQEGHMKLHARNIAISAGASGELIEKVSEIMIKEKNVKFLRAKELIKKLEK
ncbi:MAG: hydroxymethylglutaryl-CoA reductase, degradative [Thaumarchaeota archaeon]|nr:hydroxymethylglutaryl-CoA reductase, degradative [Nitrososphaerota archaeon]|tara:strand:+ start:3341 stop:4606 length:1266 start_codon:yes stop_codon:yes gene_type:complete